MKSGVRFDKMAPGELVYLNVSYHPGSKRYRRPPSPPTNVRIQAAGNLGYPGIEVRWSPSHDEHWVSYYEIARNQKVVDIVAKGTYYFDHSAGADLAATYSVRAVNGGGLKSDEAAANSSVKQRPAVILDDQDSGLSFSGKWQREEGLQPAYEGTLANSDEQGANVQFTVRGSKFTWFTRLCAECGVAQISLDDREVATVDTYSADDIFGVGVYSKALQHPGPHRVKITVSGKHAGPRGHGTRVYVDGVSVQYQ